MLESNYAMPVPDLMLGKLLRRKELGVYLTPGYQQNPDLDMLLLLLGFMKMSVQWLKVILLAYLTQSWYFKPKNPEH